MVAVLMAVDRKLALWHCWDQKRVPFAYIMLTHASYSNRFAPDPTEEEAHMAAGAHMAADLPMEEAKDTEAEVVPWVTIWAKIFPTSITAKCKIWFPLKKIFTLNTRMSPNDLIKTRINGALAKISVSMGEMFPSQSLLLKKPPCPSTFCRRS